MQHAVDPNDHDLCVAIAALAERKHAAYGSGLERMGEPTPDRSRSTDMAPLLIGTGLTVPHVAAHAAAVGHVGAQQIAEAIERGVSREYAATAVVAGAWSEGVLTGLLMAERRAREGR
jgi:hypothetical protein